jgi:hypothetical protein
MPETIGSLEFTLVNDGTTPLDSVVAVLPLPYTWLHTVKARLDVGGTLANGMIRIFDGIPPTHGDESILYDSGVVAWTADAVTISVADALLPKMPITSNFSVDPVSGDPINGALLVVTPTVATGAWTVVVRLTVSKG